MSDKRGTEDEQAKIRQLPISDYIVAHANGGEGWRGFLRSNLFAALVIWLLGQTLIVGGASMAISRMYGEHKAKDEEWARWRGAVDARLDRMDNDGTTHSHFTLDNINLKIGGLDERTKKIEQQTDHLDVLETEHKRLTNDVEKLKNGK